MRREAVGIPCHLSVGYSADVVDSLALAEMKLLLQAVYSKFTTLPDATMTPADMEMSDQLISSRPAGQRCLLRFVPLDTAE